MIIYLMYFLIIFLTILLIIIIKDKKKALKLTGMLTSLSGILLISIIFIIKLLLDNYISMINISSITKYLFNKFMYTSLILFTIGLIEIIISKFLKPIREKAANI